MAENWENGLPDEGRSPNSGYRMDAEGMPFPWRWDGAAISTDLYVIWEMSVQNAAKPLNSGHRMLVEENHSNCGAIWVPSLWI